MTLEVQIAEHVRALEALGCVAVVFTEDELRGADPRRVEDRLIELGFEVIDTLASEEQE